VSQGLMDLLANPLVWKVLLFYWIFSAAVGSMPTPSTNTNGFYIFLFRFAHSLSGNLNRAAVALHVPAAEEKSDAAGAGN
jgi:hypothetical protein